jgi:ankyrin repeat protein
MYQEDKTYLSPLHYAVKNQYLRCVEQLLNLKVDVNSVAGSDILPLNLAQGAEDSPVSRSIITLLLQK